eukprot:gene2543-3069_t
MTKDISSHDDAVALHRSTTATKKISHSLNHTKIVTFVSRGKRYRHIANRDQVIKLFQKLLSPPASTYPHQQHNRILFQVIDSSNTSQFTFQRQIEIAYNSDVVITPHGAYLSNMVFMRPYTLVIEVTCPFMSRVLGQAWVMYSHVADNFRIQYMRLFAPAFKLQNMPKFELPVSEVHRAASAILAYFHDRDTGAFPPPAPAPADS